MRIARLLTFLSIPLAAIALAGTVSSCCSTPPRDMVKWASKEQVPSWSHDDMAFYLHGSMSTEVVPETVMRAFFIAYPDVFPTRDFSHIGAIPDPEFGWPVGFSRAKVPHLGGLSSVGINCAVCHTSDIHAPGERTVRVLGTAALFDAEAFFGSVVVSTFRSEDPANMKKFLWAYLTENDAVQVKVPVAGTHRAEFDALWEKQLGQITAVMAADPSGAKGAGPGGLQDLSSAKLYVASVHLSQNPDLAALSINMLKLFHNMRTALHVPDQPPEKLPPSSGPGRNDAFGLLSAGLFNSVQPYGPVKYGIVWNLDQRGWVHWDGNTPSPLARNILAALGLGAPLVGNEGRFDMKLVQRQTDITEKILPPRYPYDIDQAAAARGKITYDASCIACHTGGYGDDRLYSPDVVGTDPTRAKLFTPAQADGFNKFLGGLKTPGYTPPAEGLRSTGKYYAPALAGVWARSPYLHNGSVRTIEQLLMPPATRATAFHRGSTTYDPAAMGFTDEGAYIFDTKAAGNANTGHDYGTNLTPAQKRDLIEYLKML